MLSGGSELAVLCDDGDGTDDVRPVSGDGLDKSETKLLLLFGLAKLLLMVAWWATGLIEGVAKVDEKSIF